MRPILTVSSLYGRTNNRIQSMLKIYELAVRHHALAVVPQDLLLDHTHITEWFDLQSAFEPHHLAIVSVTLRMLLRHSFWKTILMEKDQLILHQNTSLAPGFYKLKASSLFHAPIRTPSLGLLQYSCKVRTLAAKVFPLLNSCGEALLPYIGVHMRWLEGSCLSRMKQNPLAFDICHMTPELVREVRTHLGLEFAPVYLANDGQQPEDITHLQEHGVICLDYGLDPGDDDPEHLAILELRLAIDQYILTNAEVFIGNPTSSVSRNVCVQRSANGKGCFELE